MGGTLAVPSALNRWLSVTGLAPLGAFLIIHVGINATVLWGAGTFHRTATVLQSLPALWLIETLFVFLPLAIHAGLGLWLVLARTPLAPPRPYPPAVRVAIRATGVAAFVFLAAHLLEFRFRSPAVRVGGAELETLIAADLSSTAHGLPWRGAMYLIGTACVSFHFVAGVWGVAASARGGTRRWAGAALGALGACLWMTFVAVVLFHATGVRPFRAPQADTAATDPCPLPSR
jgi:succinate dehydrogenase / fumarate reductase, cytochrome b subunit